MQELLPGIILFTLCVFITVLLYIVSFTMNPKTHMSPTKIAFFIALVVIVMVAFGLCIEMSQDVDLNKFNIVLFRAAVPLATLCGFFMVYQTFKTQKEQDLKAEIRSQVKDRLDYHLKNVQDFQMIDNSGEKPMPYKGRSAFRFFLLTFIKNFHQLEKEWLFIMVNALLEYNKQNDIHTEEIEEMLQNWAEEDSSDIWELCEENFVQIQSKLEVSKKLINYSCKQTFTVITYLTLFFSDETFLNWMKKNFKLELIEQLKGRDPLRNFTDESFKDLMTSLSGSTYANTIKLVDVEEPKGMFGQFGVDNLDLQVYFGHYFRNLYGLYRFIDKIENIHLRKDSARLVKTQLSTYEQALIFLNSLTPVGEVWELMGENKFFTKYKVIENIPEGMLEIIKPKEDVYPHLEFEYEEYL